MTEILPCVEIEATEPCEGAIIWLHGLGANGHDFEPIAPLLGLPQIRFVFPHAPSLAVTINGGMVMPAWYDILTLEDSPKRESIEDVKRSAGYIEALIDRELERGLAAEQILLAGFSQGGAMTLHVGPRYNKRLKGLMVLSAYLTAPETLAGEASEENRETPCFFGHGEYDPLVPIRRGRAAFDAIKALNPERAMEWHDYPMQHEVCPQQIKDIAAWLQGLFKDSSS